MMKDGSRNGGSKIRFPLPKISCSFDICARCRFCCQWCAYVSEKGCTAMESYEVLSLCKAFPILIGPGEGRAPSLGVSEDQMPPEFGAYVPLGNHCLATLDERQRSLFQFAAHLLNYGHRRFALYQAESDYFVLIRVTEPPLKSEQRQQVELSPTEIVQILAVQM